MKAGTGLCAVAGIIQDAFTSVYGVVLAASESLFRTGKKMMAIEGRDAGWNIAMLAGLLIVVIAIIVAGGG